MHALRKRYPKSQVSRNSIPGDLLSFQALGIEFDDLEIAFADTDTGEVEIQLSEEGFRIVQAAAHRLNVAPDELLLRALTLVVDTR